jgi:hypothetical protein
VSRVSFQPFDRAVSAIAKMPATHQKGVGAMGRFTRARGRRQAWSILAIDFRVRQWQLAFK